MTDEPNSLVVEVEKAEGLAQAMLTIIQGLMDKTRLTGPNMPYEMLKDIHGYLTKAAFDLERWKRMENESENAKT